MVRSRLSAAQRSRIVRGARKYYGSKRLSKPMRRAVTNIVRRNIETKLIHHTLTTTSSSTTAFYNIMNSFLNQQGVESDDFVGREVRLQSLRIKGSLHQADNANLLRVVIFRARGTYIPVAGDTDMFESTNQPLYSALDRANVGEVLMDRLYVLNTGDSSNDDIKIVRKYINFKNRRLLLRTVAESVQQYYIMYVSDSTFVAHPRVVLNMTLKLKDA